MARFAQTSGGVVTNVTEAASQPGEDFGAWVACGADVSVGWTYKAGVFAAPVVVAPADPTAWLIDVGPFFDRFGTAKMALLTSTNATVQALIKDLQIRKWIDLQRPDVAAGIDAIIALGVSGVTPALKTAILTTPVTPEENLALRKVYFS